MSLELKVIKMRKIFILSFTKKGYELAERLRSNICDHEIIIYRVKNIKEVISKIFKQGNIIIFIGAIGIAVRSIAPYIENKTKDPAIIVIDEKGHYVIPILSGHIGMGNEYSHMIANILGVKPIITTATDLNNVFSIDVFAQKNKYYICNPENIKHVASNLLEEKQVGIYSEYKIINDLPKNFTNYHKMKVGIYIGLNDVKKFDITLNLKPKIYFVGIGCKKNTPLVDIEKLFLQKIHELKIDINLINNISSIDLKKEEKGLLQLSEKYNIPFNVYSKEELEIYENLFDKSAFVKHITGVSNVCEISAYKSSKEGEIILKKFSCNGVTIAIARENWLVKF